MHLPLTMGAPLSGNTFDNMEGGRTQGIKAIVTLKHEVQKENDVQRGSKCMAREEDTIKSLFSCPTRDE